MVPREEQVGEVAHAFCSWHAHGLATLRLHAFPVDHHVMILTFILTEMPKSKPATC